ncbi:MAG: choice-of-anchor A family protein [Duganella sp.]
MSKLATVIAGVTFAAASAGGAQAAVLELDLGGAQVFSFTDFIANGNSASGSIMAGRDVSLNGYSVNQNNRDAYGQYSVIAGRDFTHTNGSVQNGATYVGRNSNVDQSGTLAQPVVGGAAPANMGALATSLTQTSQSLAALKATASVEQKWGGIYIAGTGSAVEVIDLNASLLQSGSYYNFSNMAAGATLIFNFSGNSATFSQGYGNFGGYNTLLNFTDATTLNFGVVAQASVLAPHATVVGGGGIDGTVVVNGWNASTTLNAGRSFAAVDVPGLVLPSVVPEAETWAMMLAGLGLVGFIARRRKQA